MPKPSSSRTPPAATTSARSKPVNGSSPPWSDWAAGAAAVAAGGVLSFDSACAGWVWIWSWTTPPGWLYPPSDDCAMAPAGRARNAPTISAAKSLLSPRMNCGLPTLEVWPPYRSAGITRPFHGRVLLVPPVPRYRLLQTIVIQIPYRECRWLVESARNLGSVAVGTPQA